MAPQLQRKLRGRLHDSVHVFEATAEEVKGAIQQILRQLDPLQHGEVHQGSEQSAVKRELRRIVFTLSQSSYSDLMSIIKDGICSLDMLAAQCITLEPGRQETAQAKLAQMVQDLSAQLHQALKCSLPCRCLHLLSMKLCVRSPDICHETDEEIQLGLLGTDVALSCSGTGSKVESTFMSERVWEYMPIYALPCQKSPSSLDTHTQTPSLRKLYSPFDRPEPRARRKKPSTIKGKQTGHTATATLIQSAEAASLAHQMAFSSSNATGTRPKRVDNLCEMIRKCSQGTALESGGIITDGNDSMLRCFKVCLPSPASNTIELSHSSDMIYLQEVLQSEANTSFLDYKQKMQLAVAISTAVLQLYDTPWLSHTYLSLSEAIFFRRKAISNVYYDPYIVTGVEATGMEMPRVTEHFLPPKPALVSLGVLLTELASGPIIAPAEEGFDWQYSKAYRSLPSMYSISKNYFSAVSRCLRDSDLHWKAEREDFQRDMYTHVVSLLQRDLDVM